MASEFPVSKTIRLTDLVPANYRLWAAQTEATFAVHGIMDIVLGRRLRPDDGNGRQATQAIKWDRQHALARQALLACLPPSELTKVYQLQSASEIWARLAQEHGAISIARRAIASRNFYQLTKAPSTLIQTHIDVFTAHLQDLNYNLDASLADVDVNIAFLASLGSSWQTFQQSMGERVNTLKPAMLYAEVLAFEAQRDKAETAEKAIGEGIANFTTRRGNGRIDKRRRGFPRRRHQGELSGHWTGYNKEKFCHYCKNMGHVIDECFKILWKKQTAGNEDQDERSGHGEAYNPIFTGGNGRIFNRQ